MEVVYLGCILGLAIKISSSYCSEPEENTSVRLLLLIILLGFRIGFVLSNFLQLLVVCMMATCLIQRCFMRKDIDTLVSAWASESKSFCEVLISEFGNITGAQMNQTISIYEE